MEKTTIQLVEAMQTGDRQAFDELYNRYATRLYRTTFLICGNKEDSEDVLQETFINCYLHCSELKNPEVFEAWLMKILVRTSWRITKGRKTAVSADELLQREENGGLVQEIFRDKNEPEPLDQVIIQEKRETLMSTVKDLDLKLRTVVVLYYYEECSVKEIARLVGCLEGTVKSRLHTARTKLKKQLEHSENNIKAVRRTTV